MSEIEPPVNDDEFDALWDKAVAEATRQRPRLSSVPKDPSERTTPRTGPGLSPGIRQRPKAKLQTLSSGRRLTTGDGEAGLKLEVQNDVTRRHTAMARSMPLTDSMSSQQNGSGHSPARRDTFPMRDELRTDELVPTKRSDRRMSVPIQRDLVPSKLSDRRRSSTMTLGDVSGSHNVDFSRHSSESELSISEVELNGRHALERQSSSISFSNLPELLDLLKKPTTGTAATACSDYSSKMHHTSKTSPDETDAEDGEGVDADADELNSSHGSRRFRLMARAKKVSVKDAQREVANYVLDGPTPQGKDDGEDTPLFSLPSIHSISSFKENKDQLSGLVISRDAGCEVLVRKITPTSIFAETPLRQGMEILTINDRRVKCPMRATTIVKSIKGEVNLLVSEGKRPPGTKYIKAKIDRLTNGNVPAADSASVKSGATNNIGLGIALEMTVPGLVKVAQIEEEGVFGSTPLRENDVILALNGVTAQSVDYVMEKLLHFYRKGGVINMLVYSMIDLRLGLVDRIVKSPWECLWDEDLKRLTLSRPSAVDEEQNVSLFIVFDDKDWSCELLPSDSEAVLGSDAAEINAAVDEFNGAISIAVSSWIDAIERSKESDLFTAAC